MTELNHVLDPGLLKHVFAVGLVLLSAVLGYTAIRKVD